MTPSEDGFQGFCDSTLCQNSSARFPELVRPLFQLLHDFLCCPCNLSMEYFNTHSFLVSAMGVIVYLASYFLYVLNQTFRLLGPLEICSKVLSPPILWKLPSLLCFPTINPKLRSPSFTDKILWSTFYLK